MDVAVSEATVMSPLLAEPAQRKNFVDAAKYFDAIGDTDTANSLHNGVMPASLIAKYELDTFESVDSTVSDSCKRVFFSSPHTERFVAPKNDDLNRNTIFTRSEKNCPPEFIDILYGGSFVYNGMDKLFVDGNDVRIKDHSDINSYLSQRLAGKAGSDAMRFKGLTLVLVARNASNFYHWHFDILPVIGMLKTSGILLSDIDNIVIPGSPSRFQLEMLAGLGVRDSQLHRAEPGYHHIACEQLILPRIHNSMGLRQPRKHVDWLRSEFLPGFSDREISPSKIAIMREHRGFDNQAEVELALEEAGYRSVYPERLSYIEQVHEFSNASHIVSPHGAALTLLTYCNPGTVVHELYGEHVHPCFWSLSSTLGLIYHNYNCSEIYNEDITNAGRGLAERARKSFCVSTEILQSIVNA